MHRAIQNTHAIKRARELSQRQAIRDDLEEMFTGMARVIAGRLVWRHGVDLFRIEGSDGQHDTVSAVAVLTGAGNPLPATPN